MADKKTMSRAANQNKQAMKWQLECVEISRLKAKQQWWGSFRRRVMALAAVTVIGYAGAASWWLIRSGQVTRAHESVNSWVYNVTRGAGFELDHIRIEGLNAVSPEYIYQAMQVAIGDPILPVSVGEIRTRIEALPEIRLVRVERALPDTLVIHVVEREASALWQNKGEYRLIDLDGTVLANQERNPAHKYVLLVGEDAPKHAEHFLSMIRNTPEMEDRVESAVRVGARRWDVHLTNGIVIKLPESNSEVAWKRFAEMAAHKGLLRRHVRSIDMRIEDRLFVQYDNNGEGDAEVVVPAHDV